MMFNCSYFDKSILNDYSPMSPKMFLGPGVGQRLSNGAHSDGVQPNGAHPKSAHPINAHPNGAFPNATHPNGAHPNNNLVFHPNTDWILAVATILVVAIYFIWLSYFLGCQPRT